MVGITLSSEQIRTAPADVRRWIEREVLTSLGLQMPVANQQRKDQLSACNAEDVAAILSQIQGVLPAVNVFFEFGRQGATVGLPGLEAFRLMDIANHTRLHAAQVMACLDLINEALCRFRENDTARFFACDNEGHCFIAVQTQQNILRLWQEVIANQQLEAGAQENGGPSLMPANAPQALNPSPDGAMNGQTNSAGIDGAATARQ